MTMKQMRFCVENERQTLHLSNNNGEKERSTKRLMTVKHMNFLMEEKH
jgi:hypothetical protein